VNKKIIQKVNSGDKKAFQIVFEAYFNALCAFSYKYIADRSETEDLVQDVFISFWEHKKGFNHINAIKAFLYTSARNKCLNHLKHILVKQKHEAALIYELESEQFFTNHVIEEDAFNQLYSEIRALPNSSQKIMLLVLKGLKNREIAEKLNVSENTVKTQKKIAYAKLKQILNFILYALLLSL
jgi:RNA polymerase sigma-70 factor (ECF subfamily)